MNRRGLLKVLPLAAMAGATVKVGEIEAQAVEVKPDKKYVFVVSDAHPEAVIQQCLAILRERGINATIVTGVEDLKIYELE
jgi:hypothetical protein